MKLYFSIDLSVQSIQCSISKLTEHVTDEDRCKGKVDRTNVSRRIDVATSLNFVQIFIYHVHTTARQFAFTIETYRNFHSLSRTCIRSSYFYSRFFFIYA